MPTRVIYIHKHTYLSMCIYFIYHLMYIYLCIQHLIPINRLFYFLSQTLKSSPVILKYILASEHVKLTVRCRERDLRTAMFCTLSLQCAF